MTNVASQKKRARWRVHSLAAVLIASALAALAAWLLVLPTRGPARLAPFEPRPDLLDKPHRHQVALAPGAAAGPSAR